MKRRDLEPEKWRAYDRAYYRAHREEIHARKREYNASRREEKNERQRGYRGPDLVTGEMTDRPACMSDDEMALWRELYVEPGSHSVKRWGLWPCVDCPIGFAIDMRAEGRCDGTPGFVAEELDEQEEREQGQKKPGPIRRLQMALNAKAYRARQRAVLA